MKTRRCTCTACRATRATRRRRARPIEHEHLMRILRAHTLILLGHSTTTAAPLMPGETPITIARLLRRGDQLRRGT
jgi:hypothetical protein